jgi:hypothetical protein
MVGRIPKPVAAPPRAVLSGHRSVSDGIHIRPDDRKALLRHYRGSPAPAVRLRCHILLLLDAGRPWGLIAAVLFTSTATINRWRRAYLRGGIDAVLVGTPGRRPAQWWNSVEA